MTPDDRFVRVPLSALRDFVESAGGRVAMSRHADRVRVLHAVHGGEYEVEGNV